MHMVPVLRKRFSEPPSDYEWSQACASKVTIGTYAAEAGNRRPHLIDITFFCLGRIYRVTSRCFIRNYPQNVVI